VAEANDNSNAKRSKPNEDKGNENGPVIAEDEAKKCTSSEGDEKQNKNNTKPPEPPKDYIHVRARRGQATDSHSLAERVRIIVSILFNLSFYILPSFAIFDIAFSCCIGQVRREKISERMKLLQDLVPGCNKV
jgi:hypothetical protein